MISSLHYSWNRNAFPDLIITLLNEVGVTVWMPPMDGVILYFGLLFVFWMLLFTHWMTLLTHGWLMLLTHWLMLNAITAQSMIWMCMLLYQTKCLTFFIVYTAELDEQLDQGNTQNMVSWSFFSFTNACFTISNSWGRLMSRLWCIVVTPDFGV